MGLRSMRRDVDDDDGDVVPPAGGERRIHEGVGGLGRGRAGGELASDRGVVELFRETVGELLQASY